MKWRHKQTRKVAEVIDDEGKFRFYVWADDPQQEILKWDFIYDGAWADHFDLVGEKAA